MEPAQTVYGVCSQGSGDDDFADQGGNHYHGIVGAGSFGRRSDGTVEYAEDQGIAGRIEDSDTEVKREPGIREKLKERRIYRDEGDTAKAKTNRRISNSKYRRLK